MVSADDRIVVAAPHLVHSRLKLNYVVDMRSIFNRPVHTTADAALRKPALGISTRQLLKHLQHPILVKAAIRKVNFAVDPKLQLSALLRRRRIDARGGQASQMILALLRIQYVNRFVARFQPILYEREQHAIFFLVIVKKRADVTNFAKLGPG
jgi:hypothetical protein